MRPNGVQEQPVRVGRRILGDVAGRKQRVGATFPAGGTEYRGQARLRIDPEEGRRGVREQVAIGDLKDV